MSSSAKTLTEQAHDAVVAEVKKTSANAVTLDVNMASAEASIDFTKAKWTFTAYVKKVFKGAFSTGARISRPLGILSLFSRKNDES